jgi:hypothetical protein
LEEERKRAVEERQRAVEEMALFKSGIEKNVEKTFNNERYKLTKQVSSSLSSLSSLSSST